MGIFEDFKSGNCTIYGQWSAILSIVLLIIFGITAFVPVFPFALFGFGLAAVMVLLEIPLITAWCPCTGPLTEKVVKFFANPWFRAALYAGSAALLWLSIAMATTALVVAAIGVSVTCILYFVAAFKKDTPSSGVLSGGKKAGATARATVQKSSGANAV